MIIRISVRVYPGETYDEAIRMNISISMIAFMLFKVLQHSIYRKCFCLNYWHIQIEIHLE